MMYNEVQTIYILDRIIKIHKTKVDLDVLLVPHYD